MVRCLIKHLKATNQTAVEIVHCNNAGENKQLQTDCLNDGLGIVFEYTDPGTPQQNGRGERKFATLYG